MREERAAAPVGGEKARRAVRLLRLRTGAGTGHLRTGAGAGPSLVGCCSNGEAAGGAAAAGPPCLLGRSVGAMREQVRGAEG